MAEYDLVIRNGTIVDGEGTPGYEADLAVSGGRIAAVGSIPRAAGRRELDVRGHVVAPGFVDSHSHSDFALLTCPAGDSKVVQGVTTEVIGNCGSSAAPVGSEASSDLLEALGSAGLDDVAWSTVAEYRRLLEERGVGVNVAPLIGHGSLRSGVMGYEARTATGEELQKMEQLLADGLRDGAFGLSSGLIYPPGSYAPTAELEALAGVVGRTGGVYTTHMRSEADELEEAVEEALRVGRAGRVPVLISHHKAAGKRNWGKLSRTLAMMAEARTDGQQVACDVYPYLAGSTSLSAVLPGWVHEGGHEALLERLRHPEHRARITHEFRMGLPGWENFVGLAGWGNIMVTNAASEANRELPGKTVAEIAELRGVDPATAAFDLLLEEDGKVGMVLFMMDESDLVRVLRDPWTMIGSDASIQPMNGDGKPHPRAFGTFPRVLGHYVRDKGLLSLEEAVRKMTGLPASYLGLGPRGRLATGMRADVVVLDPDTVTDRATYVEPRQSPLGIPYVFVGGVAVVEDGEQTGARPGRVLVRERD